jgi:phosphate transport system substrate-binding protein
MLNRSWLAGVILVLTVGVADARDKIRIVGSSAVLPVVTTVAENFSHTWDYPSPSLEFTGTGAGFRLFCSGVGFEHPDINVTPRAMTDGEFEICRARGVTDITEMVIGLDGIVLVNSRASPRHDFKRAELFAALAAEVEVEGKIVRNRFKRWAEIHPSLPDAEIEIMGPPPTSATYDALLKLVMEPGCETFPKIAALGEGRRFRVCHTLRRDGVFIEGTKNENALIEWLRGHPTAFGIARFSLLRENAGVIAGNLIEGVSPTLDSHSNGSYALSRPVFLYVKKRHVDAIKGLQQFLYEVASERAIGPDGYLAEKSFIPLDNRGRNRVRDLTLSLATISR